MKFNPNLHEKTNKRFELENKKTLAGGRKNKDEEQKMPVRAPITAGTPSTFNREDYVRIPGMDGLYGNPVFISKFEVLGMNGKNYEDTHRHVLQTQNGLYIPTPAIFMPHFKNVINTYNNKGVLLDASGAQISREEHEEIYKHLTTNFGFFERLSSFLNFLG